MGCTNTIRLSKKKDDNSIDSIQNAGVDNSISYNELMNPLVTQPYK